MKFKNLMLTVCVLISVILVTGINYAQATKVENAKEKVKVAKKELKEAQTKSDKDYTKFKADAELKIDANDKSIKEFKNKLSTADEKYKAKYEKKITVLEERNTALKKKISDYKYEGNDQWIIFKRGFNRDLKAVGKGISDLFSKKK